MSSVLDILSRRRSTRAYSDKPVTAADKSAILQAALRAPTAGNMMLYTILEIEEQSIKDRLAITCDHQPFIAKAPFVLLFLADYQRWIDYFHIAGVEALCHSRGIEMRQPQEGDLLLACCDALIAAQTAVIAAQSLGIGSCYIGDVLEQYEVHRKLFDLPQYALPITVVCFGYPTSAQAARKQPARFAKEVIVHKNSYHRLGNSDLEQMMLERTHLLGKTMAGDGLLNAGQENYINKFIADFSIEMNRSVSEMIRSWTGKPG
jgi:FMN reductase (NADPH)/FMN reductase [NAD(P)H]